MHFSVSVLFMIGSCFLWCNGVFSVCKWVLSILIFSGLRGTILCFASSRTKLRLVKEDTFVLSKGRTEQSVASKELVVEIGDGMPL